MRRLASLLALVVLVLGVAACGSDEPATTSTDDGGATTSSEPDGAEPGNTEPAPVDGVPDLDGRTFVAQTVTGYDLVEGSELRLTFEDGRLSVNAGCNTIGGGYVVEGATLRFDGDAASTQMACEEPLMAQDTWISGLLTEGMEVALSNDELTLSSDDVTIELQDATVAEPAAPIVGTTWTLDTLIEGESASSLPAGMDAPTLEIADDGAVTVFAGCNRGGGSATVADDGSSIDFGPLATTRMACEGDRGTVETLVLTVLDGEVAAEVTADRLTLTNGDRGLVFQAS